jgi:zinc finger MYND domain-containing protein 10
VQSLELSMWSRVEKDGKIFKYIENKWKLIPLNERNQLTKTEGQVWISLYELLLSPNCVSKYDYTDYKKNQILKVLLINIVIIIKLY